MKQYDAVVRGAMEERVVLFACLISLIVIGVVRSVMLEATIMKNIMTNPFHRKEKRQKAKFLPMSDCPWGLI